MRTTAYNKNVLVKKDSSLLVVVATNPLDRMTWRTYIPGTTLTNFIVSKFPTWPENARIYHNQVSEDFDVTPHPLVENSIDNLNLLRGTVYIVVWPGAPALVSVGVSLALSLASFAIRSLLVKDEKVTARKVPQGSPNNFPGDRQNQARVLERIPDIYGRVKTTPDLLQAPYIRYENNLQVEISYMCIGQGTYDITASNVKEGESLVSDIPGASVEIYPPNEVPGSGTPQLTVGEAIGETLYNVIPIKEVHGLTLLPPNNTFVHGDLQQNNDEGFRNAALFAYMGDGVGMIRYHCGGIENEKGEVLDKFQIGDKVGLAFHPSGVSVYNELLSDSDDLGGTPDIDEEDRPDLELLPESEDDDHYEIVDIDDSGLEIVLVYISIPDSVLPEWEAIAAYNPTGYPSLGGAFFPSTNAPAPAESLYNRRSVLYLLNFRQGPFFVDDPNMTEIHVNVTAPNGLWVDDGREQKAYNSLKLNVDHVTGVEFAIEVTPADEDGDPTGPKQVFSGQSKSIAGSSSRRDLVGQTFKIDFSSLDDNGDPFSTTGRFIFSIYRKNLSPFRMFLRSYMTAEDTNLNGGANNDPNRQGRKGIMQAGVEAWSGNFQVQDEIIAANAYSMSVPLYPTSTSFLPVDSFGDVTTVLCKRVQRRFFREEPERRLNITCTRVVDIWDDDAEVFLPDLASVRGVDVLFHVLRHPKLGNMEDSAIDFVGIAEAFDAVRDAFNDQEAVNFSHTFDNKDTSLEDIITAIGEACFVTIYRQGDVIKATPDISTNNASLLFNHRNKIPDDNLNLETRNVTFATEEEYDGIEVEYTDNDNNQIQNYVIPAPGVPRNALQIKLAGIRTRKKAAFHAWRAHHQVQYKNTIVEFTTPDEGSLGLVEDKIIVANDSHPNTKAGEIVDFNGLILYTSQEAQVFGPSTLFLQGYEGEVAMVPVTQGDNLTSLVLSSPLTSGILYLDPEGAMNTKYVLISDTFPRNEAFRVSDKQQEGNGTYRITAYNYTEGYYFYDGLYVWLPFKSAAGFPAVFNFDDRSAYGHEPERIGTAGTTTDSARGVVYLGQDPGDHVFIEDPQAYNGSSYTIAAWVLNQDDGLTKILGSDDELNDLIFFIQNTTKFLCVIHDNVTHITGSTPIENEWQHVAVTYDLNTEVLTTYINGEVEETATSVPAPPSFNDIILVGGLIGKADSVRYYKVAKSNEFIRELYQKEFLE